VLGKPDAGLVACGAFLINPDGIGGIRYGAQSVARSWQSWHRHRLVRLQRRMWVVDMTSARFIKDTSK
jgi:hypothetical protein